MSSECTAGSPLIFTRVRYGMRYLPAYVVGTEAKQQLGANLTQDEGPGRSRVRVCSRRRARVWSGANWIDDALEVENGPEGPSAFS